MNVRTVRVSSKGQISLPAPVRKGLGIRKGSELVLLFDGRRILLQPAEQTARAIRDEFGGLLRASEAVLRRLWENPEDEVWDHV